MTENRCHVQGISGNCGENCSVYIDGECPTENNIKIPEYYCDGIKSICNGIDLLFNESDLKVTLQTKGKDKVTIIMSYDLMNILEVCLFNMKISFTEGMKQTLIDALEANYNEEQYKKEIK